MELREIKTFIEVADLKSFSKAAGKLGYSQAAVTIQIKQLERELNVHLFDRIGKQTTLTHEGENFMNMPGMSWGI
ncbi:LysR family transcriptional regulator [Lachnospiraceae bacterium 54-53]